MSDELIVWFGSLTLDDVPKVGGKNASLGEMVGALSSLGVRVPDGFATTSDAWMLFLAHNGLEPVLRARLAGLDVTDVVALQACGAALRAALLGGELPPSLVDAIGVAYRQLCGDGANEVDVAVRSSATAEDLPDASFAGQQETFLHVRGLPSVLEHVRRCFASLYTDRAITYRAERGYDHLKVALSVGVQRMVRSDLASAGVIFTLDTETGFPDLVVVTGAWGLGENVVQGAVVPDEFGVFKPTLAQGFRPIVRKNLGEKAIRMVFDDTGDRRVANEDVSPGDRARFVLTDDEVLELARQAVRIEQHYTARHGRPTPMDIEWAKDGLTGELFIVQARPETVQRRKGRVFERTRLTGTGEVLVTGRAVGDRVATGAVRVLRDPSELSTFQDGEILVAERTDPDWEPVMRRAAAIVTDKGGRTCHAAIVARELGVPAVVGATGASRALASGAVVTVSCAHGEEGRVYAGAIAAETERVDLDAIARPKTKIKLNLGDPGEAFRVAVAVPNDGVGLMREEFVISSFIGIHPRALLAWPDLPPAIAAEVAARTVGYDDKRAFFVDRLSLGIGAITAAFWPNEVLVRLSDFKTNEYAGLLGGAAFEPHEENPMIGLRGASRYDHPDQAEAFALECAAIRRVRDEMGLTNLKVMVPFCRTVEEGRRVLARMATHGLARGVGGLEVYVMCEIPSNAILAEDFAEIFDGFSIGSNDLTQLTLGVDRDSEVLAPLFSESDPAVTWLIRRAIHGAHAKGRPIGLCGQAPSDHPAFAAFLVEAGIDSISLSPDAVPAAVQAVLAAEARLHR
jgi:pyruvate,water dikinase